MPETCGSGFFLFLGSNENYADNIFNGHNPEIHFLIFSYMAHRAYSFHCSYQNLAQNWRTYWKHEILLLKLKVATDISILIPSFHGVIIHWSWSTASWFTNTFFQCAFFVRLMCGGLFWGLAWNSAAEFEGGQMEAFLFPIYSAVLRYHHFVPQHSFTPTLFPWG